MYHLYLGWTLQISACMGQHHPGPMTTAVRRLPTPTHRMKSFGDVLRAYAGICGHMRAYAGMDGMGLHRNLTLRTHPSEVWCNGASRFQHLFYSIGGRHVGHCQTSLKFVQHWLVTKPESFLNHKTRLTRAWHVLTQLEFPKIGIPLSSKSLDHFIIVPPWFWGTPHFKKPPIFQTSENDQNSSGTHVDQHRCIQDLLQHVAQVVGPSANLELSAREEGIRGDNGLQLLGEDLVLRSSWKGLAWILTTKNHQKPLDKHQDTSKKWC